MQFPINIHILNFTLDTHLFFELLAFFVGFRYFLFLRKNQIDTISESRRISILIGAALGALIGSRLLGALENPFAFFDSANPWLYAYENKTILGGLLGGLFGVELIKWLIGEKQSSGDLFAYPIMLGMIIGRIGCFSKGIYEPTFGVPTLLPWGMDLGDGIPRHPNALYEIIFLAFWWVLMLRLEKNYAFQQGARFKFFLIGYLMYRLWIDFLKPDIRLFLGLTSIQIACLIGLLYYWKVFVGFPKNILQAKATIQTN